jgi:glycerol uptake facilitator-like aquaporin
MASIHIAGGLSGAHCNPMISIGLAIFRGFPWAMVWQYILAQLAGAFCGAAISFGIYQPLIDVYEGGAGIRTITGDHPSAPIFVTIPQSVATPVTSFFNEFVASAVLGIMVLAIADEGNSPATDGMSALILGLVVTMIGMAL